jgi:hypothetical protein
VAIYLNQNEIFKIELCCTSVPCVYLREALGFTGPNSAGATIGSGRFQATQIKTLDFVLSSRSSQE